MKSASSASLSSGKLAPNQFELVQQIGTGSFGTVFKAIHRPSQKECAIKRIDLEDSDDDIEEIQKEIGILATCHDNHITRYYGCFMYEFELWIVMEYLGGGSCLDLVKDLRPESLSEAAIAEILAQVVEGLMYLHESGKIHRDIKAANVLIADNGDVKIADFGVAAQLSNNLSRRNTFVGTPFWMAPEVIDQLDHSFSADIWSLGITAIELAVGKPPLSNLHPMKALFNIPRSAPPRLDKRFSPEFQDFVAQCLQFKPELRWTVLKLRKHPFFKRRSRQELLKFMHKRLPPTTPSISRQHINSKLSNKSSSSDVNTTNSDEFGTVSRSIAPARSSSSFASTSSSSASSSFSASSPDGSRTLSDKNSHFRAHSTDSESTVYSHSSYTAPSISSDKPSSFHSANTSHTNHDYEEEEDDGWDFDTIKPQPSLEQILQNPPPSLQAPAPIPPSPSQRKHSRAVSTRDISEIGNGTVSGEMHSLVRIFSHASHKFKEPVLMEISELLRTDPPTVAVEQYLLKRIGKLTASQPPKDKSFDAVERILLDKWKQEVTKLHEQSM